MLFIKTRSKSSKLAALFLIIVLCISALIPIVTSFAAVGPVTSPDGSVTYGNDEVTYVTSDTTVLVNYTPGNTVYYSFDPGDAVDVYYNDVSNKPNGSYFPGNQTPTVNGGHVTRIGYAPSASNGGALLGSDSLITVAAPGFEKSRLLTIAAYNNGVLDGVYTHNFAYAYSLTLSANQNYADANFDNGGSGDVAVTVIVAAYDVNNRLLALSYDGVSETPVASKGRLSVRLNTPAGTVYYNAFALHPDTWVPLLPSVAADAV